MFNLQIGKDKKWNHLKKLGKLLMKKHKKYVEQARTSTLYQ